MGDFQEPYGATCLGIGNTLWSCFSEIRVYLMFRQSAVHFKLDRGYNPLNWLKPIPSYSDSPWNRPGSRSLTIFWEVDFRDLPP